MDEQKEERKRNGGKLVELTDEDYEAHFANLEEMAENDEEVYEEL